jgi:monoamine oxidase
LERIRTDYCVVGAGFAGLAAARRLRNRGKSVALVEARDRVGGRVWNRTAADGSVVSVGGTWLGKRQDRMFELCREFGLQVYPQYDRGDTIMHLDGKNRRYQGNPKIGLLALLSFGLAFWRLDRMVKRLPIDEPWKASGARALDSQTLGAWFGSRWNVPSAMARKLINTIMTTLFCVDPDEVSLLGSLVLARGGGSFEYYVDSTITETHLVDRGVPELAVRLAATLGDALHLSSPVRLIRQSNAAVEVLSDRLTFDARRVIVATPPLLASRIEYDPALPAAQAQLLRRMMSGSALRGITIYDEPFWRNEGLSGMSVAPDLPVPVALDQSPPLGKSRHSQQLHVRTAGGQGSGARCRGTARHLAAGACRPVWRQSLVAKGASGNRLGRGTMVAGRHDRPLRAGRFDQFRTGITRAGGPHSLGRLGTRNRNARTDGRRRALRRKRGGRGHQQRGLITGKQIPSDIPPTALPEPLGWRGDLGDEIAHQLRVGQRLRVPRRNLPSERLFYPFSAAPRFIANPLPTIIP